MRKKNFKSLKADGSSEPPRGFLSASSSFSVPFPRPGEATLSLPEASPRAAGPRTPIANRPSTFPPRGYLARYKRFPMAGG